MPCMIKRAARHFNGVGFFKLAGCFGGYHPEFSRATDDYSICVCNFCGNTFVCLFVVHDAFERRVYVIKKDMRDVLSAGDIASCGIDFVTVLLAADYCEGIEMW